MKPYSEQKTGNIIRRTFSHLVESEELVWHRDSEDRIVIPLNENNWMVQFDNELPKKLNVNEEFFIPKNTFHRVIKGSGDLMVEIIETKFEDDELVVYEAIEEGKKKKGKKDACYYKVRSRYDVWPSAYASGALVKCRQVGAANWGNSADESVKFFGDDAETIEEKWSEEYKKSIDCNNPKGFSQKAHCQGRKKTDENVEENLEVYEAKKTDFSKEKEQGLHGWFARKGGEGKSQGWVDCNTCRKDPETGRKKCKPCGREEGEKRAKYPACRPTPSACGTPKKGESWGKKSNENLSMSENLSIFEPKNIIKNMLRETFGQDDTMAEPMTKPAPVKPKTVPVEPVKQPSRKDKPFLPMPNVQPDPKAEN